MDSDGSNQQPHKAQEEMNEIGEATQRQPHSLATSFGTIGNKCVGTSAADKTNPSITRISTPTTATTSALEYETSSLTLLPSTNPTSAAMAATMLASMTASRAKMPPSWFQLASSSTSSSSLSSSKHDQSLSLPSSMSLSSQEQLLSLIRSQYYALGYDKITTECRQLGSILVLLGVGTTYSTMSLIGYLLEGMSGEQQIEGFRLPLVVANFIQLVSGVASIVTGMYCLLALRPVQGPNTFFHKWCKWLVVIVNLGPISLIISIIQLCLGTVEIDTKSLEVMDHDTGDMHNETHMMMNIDEMSSFEFVPSALHPTSNDVIFVVCMGILNLVSVCATLIGGLTVCSLQLCAYQAYQPHSRTKHYHLIRLGYYCILVIIGAVAQIALGMYCWCHYGFGPYIDVYDGSSIAVHIATHIIQVPLLPIMVGTFQLGFGYYGFNIAYRTKLNNTAVESDNVQIGLFDQAAGENKQRLPVRNQVFDEDGVNRNTFQFIALMTWLITFFLQFLFPPAYGEDHDFLSNGASFASVYMGFFIMPVYLEYLVRTTPTFGCAETYGLPYDAPSGRPDLLVGCFYGKESVNYNSSSTATTGCSRKSVSAGNCRMKGFNGDGSAMRSFGSSFHDEEQRG